MSETRPPDEISVIKDGGVTIESKPPWPIKERFNLEKRIYNGKLRIGDSLWRKAAGKLHGTAKLWAYDTKSFWQTNNDVTVAIYRLKGYSYPILAWFDNKTGHRIA